MSGKKTECSFEVHVETHVGKVRQHNEDAALASEELGVCVVADGMGGHRGGKVASKLAVDVFSEVIRDYRDAHPFSKYDANASNVIQAAFSKANQSVLMRGTSDRSVKGMATTMVTGLVSGDHIITGNVGDSRMYRMQKGELKQITTDHSWINENLAGQNLSDEAMRTHLFRNIVTRAIGIECKVKTDVEAFKHEKNDLFLLCSDGLTDMLKTDEIEKLLNKPKDALKKIAKRLVDKANTKGGIDNITVGLIRFR